MPDHPSIEGRGSWVAAAVTLAILSISYGSPLLIVVGLKEQFVALVVEPRHLGAEVHHWSIVRPPLQKKTPC